MSKQRNDLMIASPVEAPIQNALATDMPRKETEIFNKTHVLMLRALTQLLAGEQLGNLKVELKTRRLCSEFRL